MLTSYFYIHITILPLENVLPKGYDRGFFLTLLAQHTVKHTLPYAA